MKNCYHCYSIVPININYSLFIDSSLRLFCCFGCYSISKYICENNLVSYYKFRTNYAYNINNKNYDYEYVLNLQDKYVKIDNNDNGSVFLIVDKITCPACCWLIEKHFNNIDGINIINVDIISNQIKLVWNNKILKLSDIFKEFFNIGYCVFFYDLTNEELLYKNNYKNFLKKIIFSGISMMQVMMLSFSVYIGEYEDIELLSWHFIRLISFLFTIPVVFYCAIDIFFSFFRSIKNFNLNMDVTISLSLIIAYLSSIYNIFYDCGDVYFDSISMFIFFILISRFLEMFVRYKSSKSIFSLNKILNNFVVVVNVFNFNKKIESIHNINNGDFLLIKPGDVISFDCIIIEGITYIDESMLTGEINPILKSINSILVSGSINLDGFILVKVVNAYSDSKINLVIKLLEEVKYNKSEFIILSERIVKYFVLFILSYVVFINLIIFIFNYNIDIFNITLSILIVSCPCAFSLSTPIAIGITGERLIKVGYLIITNDILEKISETTDIIFDKTGTLTLNYFALDKIILYESYDYEFVLNIAFSLEQNSLHPISQAFLNYNFVFKKDIYHCNSITNYLNMGIEGVVNGIKYRIGKYSFINLWLNISNSKYYDNKSWIILSSQYRVLAFFKLSEPLRFFNNDLIKKLHNAKITTHLLSGDSSFYVNNISFNLNILNVQKNTSIEFKASYITKIRRKKSVIIMIGDGINDIPAFGASDISIAMASGVNITKIKSNSLLLNNNLSILCKILYYSKQMKYVIIQNIVWALFYNLFALLLATFDLLSPYIAVIGMSISSLLVILNSLRIR